MWKPELMEKTLAWARYLFWADLSHRQLDAYAEQQPENLEWQNKWYFFAHLSKWYAAEYVVIEGWRKARLYDPVIDKSLDRWADVVDMLRRYRNGVFHYQPNIVESRFEPILRDSEQSMFWANYLHTEFLRYYWTYVRDFPGTQEQRTEFMEGILHIVGWISDDIVEARVLRINELRTEVEQMTRGHADDQADDLRKTAEVAQLTADEMLARFREQCRLFLARTK